jgi:aldose 1-epimerase
MQLHRGGVLAPWPNRVGDGNYTFNGVELQLAINEISRKTSLHGLVNWHAWTVGEVSQGEATLTTRIWPQPGYEFAVDLRIVYALSATNGLTITLSATNVGDTAAPYGASVHPYLLADGEHVDDYTMTVPAAGVVDVDATRLLPTGGTTPVDGGELDFRQPRVVGETKIDHALCDVIPGIDGLAVASVVGANGRGSEIVWDPMQCPWVQVHTADTSDPQSNRVAMAVEPMTCPPDAFRTGVGLIVLDPGATTSAWWTIRRLGG